MYVGPRFTSEDDGRYYRYYCDKLATQVTRPFKSDVWRRLIPQAAEEEISIKRAIVALGALSKSKCHRDASGNFHHEYALIQYDKALKEMQVAVHRQTRDCRKFIISSILVFCLESLQGQQDSASTHASRAISLLLQWSIEQGAHGGRNPPSHCAQLLSIEEDLHSAYCGLDLQTLFFLDSQPPHLHWNHVDSMTAAMKEMPKEFVDLKDCRKFLQVAMRRNFHFFVAAGSGIEDVQPAVDHTAQVSAAFRSGNSVWSTGRSTSHPSKTIPLALREQRDRHIADIDRWQNASSHLFQKSSLPESGMEDFIVAALLKVHAAMNRIVLAGAFFPPEIEYDAYLPQFRVIVELCTTIHPHLVSDGSSMFHSDIGIIAALAQVGLHCRNSKVRHQAVDLLLNAPGYQEGIWDSVVVGEDKRRSHDY